MTKVLLTGASGFIGQHLLRGLQHRGVPTEALARGELPQSVHRADVLIHLAARAHISGEPNDVALAAFRRDNVALTISLARTAFQAGVKRFVYLSSIGVNGSCTQLPFTELDNPNPQTPYAVSKYEAEKFLHDFSKTSGMQVVIIRPPLVYGMSAPGNFAQLVSIIKKAWPLPLGSVNNSRSFIYVENLVDAIILCATHPNAAGQTYLVSDGESVSTPTFIRELSKAMGKKCLLFPFSVPVMKFFASLMGKSAAVDKLTQSLEVDDSKIRNELGWMQPYTMEQGLKATADWYLQQQK